MVPLDDEGTSTSLATRTSQNKAKGFVNKMGKLKGLVRSRRNKKSTPSLQANPTSSTTPTKSSLQGRKSPGTPDTLSESPVKSASKKSRPHTSKHAITLQTPPNAGTKLLSPDDTPVKPAIQLPASRPPRPPVSPSARASDNMKTDNENKSRISPPSPNGSESETSWDTRDTSQQGAASRMANMAPNGEAGEPVEPTTLEKRFNDAVGFLQADPKLSTPSLGETPQVSALAQRFNEAVDMLQQRQLSKDDADRTNSAKSHSEASFEEFIVRSKDEFGTMMDEWHQASKTNIDNLDEELGKYVKSAKAAAVSVADTVAPATECCKDVTTDLNTSNEKEGNAVLSKDLNANGAGDSASLDFEPGPPMERDSSFGSKDSKGNPKWEKMVDYLKKTRSEVKVSNAAATTKDETSILSSLKQSMSSRVGAISEQIYTNVRHSPLSDEDQASKTIDHEHQNANMDFDKVVDEAQRLLSLAKVGIKDLSVTVGKHMNCTTNIVGDMINGCSEIGADGNIPVELDSPSWLNLKAETRDDAEISKLTNPRELADISDLGQPSVTRAFSLDLTEIENEESFVQASK